MALRCTLPCCGDSASALTTTHRSGSPPAAEKEGTLARSLAAQQDTNGVVCLVGKVEPTRHTTVPVCLAERAVRQLGHGLGSLEQIMIVLPATFESRVLLSLA